MSLFTSQYYDKPEGEDYIGKMFATNRIAVSGAVGIGTMDILMYSHPKGLLPIASRFAWWLGPAVGMASAFTTGAYVSHRLRGTNDKWNYVVGSCAAAGVAGAWQRSAVIGFSMCVAFSIAGCIKKLSFEEDWEFFPQDALKRHAFGAINPARNDFTFTPVGEKGWTTGKE